MPCSKRCVKIVKCAQHEVFMAMKIRVEVLWIMKPIAIW